MKPSDKAYNNISPYGVRVLRKIQHYNIEYLSSLFNYTP